VTYFAATAFVLIATVNSGTNLLYFLFGLMVGALVVSILFSALSLRKVSITRSYSDHVVAGEPADVEYTVTNGKRFWPALAIRFWEESDFLVNARSAFVLYVPPRSSVTLVTQLVAPRRGSLKLSMIGFSCAFPFGFLARTLYRRFPQDLVVYPRIGMLNRHLALQYRESIESGTMTSNVRGGNDEFYGLREYRSGDNIRAIHWRSTARTQRLVIREMSANSPPQLIVVLNLRGARPGEEALVERAIELTASLICYGFFENFAVGLAIAGELSEAPPTPHMGREARSEMLHRLAVLDPGLLRPNIGINFPSRLAGRSESIVVTLHASDECGDLLSPGGAGGGHAVAHSGHCTRMPLDSPDAGEWLHFLTPEDTLRLLRSHSSPNHK
jgi:uncharacterized protein (DUF58 family)